MEEVDIPPFFLCPISLQIMKDPVIVSSGITYDRENIEKWLFSQKNMTCPVTKQLLSDSDLTPNHTLRRFIQSWCIVNASSGVERIPTPKPPIQKTEIVKLLEDAKISPLSQRNCLRRLRSISSDNQTNKRCMEAAGVVQFLAGVVCSCIDVESNSEVYSDYGFDFCGEALSILYNLQISESGLKSLLNNNGVFVQSLTKVLQNGSYGSRAYVIMLLKSIFEVADQIHLINVNNVFFVELVQVLKDQISPKSSKAALKLLITLCQSGRNKVKAIQAGAVAVLIELILDIDSASEKRISEMILVTLEMLCGCADGRAEFLNHGAGMAVVSKKIMRVSSLGTERAVGILYCIAKFSASPKVVQEMLQLGIVTKLCLVLGGVGCGIKAKDKVIEILKLHCRAWRNSPCLPITLQSFYPS